MSGTSAYVIGLDGGGTKTAAQIADLDGTVAAETQGGPSNFQIIGVEESARNILDLAETCCHSVGCNVSEIGSLVAGLAGAGRDADQQRMADALQNAAQNRGMYLRDLKIESDARVALEGAFCGKPGIILESGTGSIAFAKDAKGKIHRSGGWGRIIGDEGSGYHLGREGLRAVANIIDGRGGKSRIAGLLASNLGLKSQEDIIKAVYQEGFDIASVAPLVLSAAQKGDKVAKEIVDTAASELLGVIQPVLKSMKSGSRLGKSKTPVVLTGSLLESENVFRAKVVRLLQKQYPHMTIEKPMSPPVGGAVLMAIERAKTAARGMKERKPVV